MTLGQLRRIIREMALAGVSPAVSRHEPGAEGDPDNRRSFPDDPEERRRVEKFHGSPLYRRKAAAAFRLWGIPVYIVPVYRKDYGDEARGRYVPWEEAEPLLVKAGLDVSSLKAELGRGGCILLSTVKQVVKGFLPTPWMMLHALFDDWQLPSSASLALHRRTIFPVSAALHRLSHGGGEDYTPRQFDRALAGCMTMGSARTGRLNVNHIDMSAELCIQAAVSPRGCVIRPFSPPPGEVSPEGAERIAAGLREVEDLVNGLDVRGALEDYMRGRIVAVEVENFFTDRT